MDLSIRHSAELGTTDDLQDLLDRLRQLRRHLTSACIAELAAFLPCSFPDPDERVAWRGRRGGGVAAWRGGAQLFHRHRRQRNIHMPTASPPYFTSSITSTPAPSPQPMASTVVPKISRPVKPTRPTAAPTMRLRMVRVAHAPRAPPLDLGMLNFASRGNRVAIGCIKTAIRISDNLPTEPD